jgi:hypothetical protein
MAALEGGAVAAVEQRQRTQPTLPLTQHEVGRLIGGNAAVSAKVCCH